MKMLKRFSDSNFSKPFGASYDWLPKLGQLYSSFKYLHYECASEVLLLRNILKQTTTSVTWCDVPEVFPNPSMNVV